MSLGIVNIFPLYQYRPFPTQIFFLKHLLSCHTHLERANDFSQKSPSYFPNDRHLISRIHVPPLPLQPLSRLNQATREPKKTSPAPLKEMQNSREKFARYTPSPRRLANIPKAKERHPPFSPNPKNRAPRGRWCSELTTTTTTSYKRINTSSPLLYSSRIGSGLGAAVQCRRCSVAGCWPGWRRRSWRWPSPAGPSSTRPSSTWRSSSRPRPCSSTPCTATSAPRSTDSPPSGGKPFVFFVFFLPPRKIYINTTQ